MAAEVTLGTGMSCISSVCRGEDDGSDNEDNLDDRQQRPHSSSPKCAMREKRNPDRPTSTFSALPRDVRFRGKAEMLQGRGVSPFDPKPTFENVRAGSHTT
jgi:hypothetical protein